MTPRMPGDDYFTTSDKTMIRNWLEYVAALNMPDESQRLQDERSHGDLRMAIRARLLRR